MYKYSFLVSLLFCLAVAKHEQYIGHVVYEIKVDNAEQAERVYAIENALNLDMWMYATPARPGLVLVPGPLRQRFQDELSAAGVKYNIQIENVKEMLDMEDQMLAAAASRNNRTDGRLSFDAIYNLEAVDAYLAELAENYETVTLVSAGKSFEGRDINYLKISTTNFEDTSKPVIMIQSLLHAREWISLPASLYAIDKLVVDITEKDLVEAFDWIILPIANPDGYEYSHTGYRFWRKNRSTGHTTDDVCVGVDLNRNFNIDWGLHSSDLPCSETFHGSGPLSEPEAKAISDLIHEHSNRLELFIDIHSFGSMILYGYGNGQLPANALTLHVAGVRMAQAIDDVKWDIKPYYRVGNIALILNYMASGGASDYVQGIGVPLSYAFELPAYRNLNQVILGFLVDPAFIEQAGRETWDGIQSGARFVLEYTRANKMMR